MVVETAAAVARVDRCLGLDDADLPRRRCPEFGIARSRPGCATSPAGAGCRWRRPTRRPSWAGLSARWHPWPVPIPGNWCGPEPGRSGRGPARRPALHFGAGPASGRSIGPGGRGGAASLRREIVVDHVPVGDDQGLAPVDAEGSPPSRSPCRPAPSARRCARSRRWPASRAAGAARAPGSRTGRAAGRQSAGRGRIAIT